MNRIGVFILFVAFIILVGDLPVKVAEDFAAMGCKNQGVLGGFSISIGKELSAHWAHDYHLPIAGASIFWTF